MGTPLRGEKEILIPLYKRGGIFRFVGVCVWVGVGVCVAVLVGVCVFVGVFDGV